PAVDQPGRGLRHPPRQVIPDLAAAGEEVEGPAGRDLHLPGLPRREQLRPRGAELALERGQQAQRVGGEDLVVPVPPRGGDLYTLDGSHVALLPVMITSGHALRMVAPTLAPGHEPGQRRAGRRRAGGPGTTVASPLFIGVNEISTHGSID